jgi:hypothetical protein
MQRAFTSDVWGLVDLLVGRAANRNVVVESHESRFDDMIRSQLACLRCHLECMETDVYIPIGPTQGRRRLVSIINIYMVVRSSPGDRRDQPAKVTRCVMHDVAWVTYYVFSCFFVTVPCRRRYQYCVPAAFRYGRTVRVQASLFFSFSALTVHHNPLSAIVSD